tara:strand:- start:98 stop:934 length:837 start_codon:yes stop_codon:yes gene_type:complete
MEYKAFAYELTKVAAPKSVRGLYAQEKADRDFKSLMDSSKPGAVPKAFAKGFATGAALPLLITANMHLVNKKNTESARAAVRQFNVAEALRSMGVPKPEPIAAAFDNMAIKPDGSPRNILADRLSATRASLDTHIVHGKLQKADIPKGVRDLASSRLKEVAKAMEKIDTAAMFAPDQPHLSDPNFRRVTAMNSVYQPKRNIITPQEVIELERIGRGIKSSKRPTVGKVYARNFRSAMLRGGVGAGIIGAIAGGMSARSALKRRKRYQALKAKAQGGRS